MALFRTQALLLITLTVFLGMAGPPPDQKASLQEMDPSIKPGDDF